MLNKIFGSPLHQHPEAARRVAGVAALPPDAPDLAILLRDDPAPEVRAAAARRCVDLAALSAALAADADASVRSAIAVALGPLLAATADDAAAREILSAPHCTDAIRAEVALHAQDASRRAHALDRISNEAVLTEVALAAAHAPLRLAAAERVHAPEQLRRLFEAFNDRDRGVARLARHRLDALAKHEKDAAEADAILAQAEALVAQPGPIVMAAVELERRWKALDLGDDAPRRARWDAAGLQLQERFDRESEAQRAQARLDQGLAALLAAMRAAPTGDALAQARAQWQELSAEAARLENPRAAETLMQVGAQIEQWEQAAPALAAAEALVVEAEALAADTSIDDAQLPARWQALDDAGRIPALTQRLEAALAVIEQRRLAAVRGVQNEQGAAKQQLHTLLIAAEQALLAGQLQQARAAADEARALKLAAGLLPKPTVQRLSRVVQQLGDLERWQKFGQESVRIQLCERAEALALQTTLPPAELARDVQQLRAEWKKLDEQHAGVPKPLWERFDNACEKAYAPAARHFAELAAQHKQARKQRAEFIDAAALHATTLLEEPRDWRAIEQWLRTTDATWHGTTLGSVEPGHWKKLDTRMKAALAPLRDALSAARQQAKAEREAMIVEAQALAAKALDRDAPSQARDLQARWQVHAKGMTIAPRDERALWERFRAACNAVFDARKGARKEADQREHAQRQEFVKLCEQAEQLAAGDLDETQLRRSQRDLQDQWRKASAAGGHAPAAQEARFKAALGKLDAALRQRKRAHESGTWQALLDKEQLCAELDALIVAAGEAAPDAAAVQAIFERFAQLPVLPAAWDKALGARLDAARGTLDDEDARYDYIERIEEGAAARLDTLIELELLVGLDSPPDLQPQRVAVQVKQLRDRFKRAASDKPATGDQLLLAWCAQPGLAREGDRKRCERITGLLSLPH